MSAAEHYGAATIRRARAAARKAGHDMTPLRDGAFTAIASCRNLDCSYMLEVRGHDDWRLINLGGMTGSGHCPGATS
ncbi:MAG TPA: hypothetical protein VGW74_08015 [Propionibacteriaceae bacterium]|nr:hypothetical protein [Propionibacteriaceae bacterium]